MTENTMTQNIQIIHASHTDTSTSQSRDHVIMSELEIAISHGTHIHVALLSTPHRSFSRRSLSGEKIQNNPLLPTPSAHEPPLLPPQISLLSAFELSLSFTPPPPFFPPVLFRFSRFIFSIFFYFFFVRLVWFGSSLLLRESDSDTSPT